MASCQTLRQFLIRARDTLRQGINSRTKLTLVIGNESVDLDSITSSLLYSYIRSLSAATKSHGLTYIPIINIPSADIKLRPELLTLLPHAGLGPSELITLDDLPLANLETELPSANTRWILVDHNVLQARLGEVYGKRVVGVIDHHEDEHQVPQDTGSEPRIIEKTGSCTSLVVNHLKEQWQSLESNSGRQDGSTQTQTWSAQAARLASASILIDTANLTDKNKATDHDREAMTFLIERMSDTDQASWYRTLKQAKEDIGSLSLEDILRKDYKQWNTSGLKLGIASVVKSLDYLAAKAVKEVAKDMANGSDDTASPVQSLLNGVKQFAKHRGLDMMVIMTTSTTEEGKFQRQLLACAPSQTAARALRKFETTSSQELDLEDLDDWNNMPSCADGELDRIWRQKAVQHSRKRVAPLLREAIEQSFSDSQL